MTAPDDPTSRPPSGDSYPSDLPTDGTDGKMPLRRRIADRWKGLGIAGKASVIGGVATAAVAGGFFVFSNTRTSAIGPEPDSYNDTTDSAEVHADDQASSAAVGLALAAWFVDGYWRNTCLNPRGHATGDCTHERRPVPRHVKGPGRERLMEHETEPQGC